MKNFFVEKEKAALLIIDTQEKLISHIERPCEILSKMHQIIRGFQIFKMPIFVVEQYPKGLGSTVDSIKNLLGLDQHYFEKDAFSCLEDIKIKEELLSLGITQWVIIGIEAHICILQTVKSFLKENLDVVVLNDAISSRSIFDYSTAIAEMRDLNVRISSVETILFELMRDRKCAEFKQISQLVR